MTQKICIPTKMDKLPDNCHQCEMIRKARFSDNAVCHVTGESVREYGTYRALWCPLRDCESNENPPLTLDELRKMDGDPVWVEDFVNHKCTGWYLSKNLGYGMVGFKLSDLPAEHHLIGTNLEDGYNDLFIAYRRKREGTK